MLIELLEHGHRLKEKMKAMLSKRKMYREPTVKGRNQYSNQ